MSASVGAAMPTPVIWAHQPLPHPIHQCIWLACICVSHLTLLILALALAGIVQQPTQGFALRFQVLRVFRSEQVPGLTKPQSAFTIHGSDILAFGWIRKTVLRLYNQPIYPAILPSFSPGGIQFELIFADLSAGHL